MTTNQPGRREVRLTGVEVRTETDGDVVVRGHAAVYNSPTTIGSGPLAFEEVINPGAFTRTVNSGTPVPMLFNHNPDLVIASTKDKSLALDVRDEQGLGIEAKLLPTTAGRDLALLIKRGVVDKMSFGFQVVREKWENATRDDGTPVERRTVLEAKLFDVSAVVYPAYDATDLAAREAMLVRELRGRNVPDEARAALTVDADADEDPASLAQAIDESLDAGLAAWVDNPEQCKALIVAAAATVDRLLEALGATDPDEIEGRSSAPTDVSQDPAPAATPGPVDERSFKLTDHLLRHASGGHVTAPRAMCPACTTPDPAVEATPAA